MIDQAGNVWPGAGPCVSINWYNRRGAVPPAVLSMKCSVKNIGSYQAPGANAPLLGTDKGDKHVKWHQCLNVENSESGSSLGQARDKEKPQVKEWSETWSAGMREPARYEPSQQTGSHKDTKYFKRLSNGNHLAAWEPVLWGRLCLRQCFAWPGAWIFDPC